jgi:sugar (Glycoside-Pentoside-Hexuronide) transporter
VDRVRTKDGQFRHWYKWFAIPYLVCCILLFTNPNFDMTGKMIYVTVTYLLIWFIYSCIQVPSSAQIVEMTKSSKEISIINVLRFLSSNLSNIFFGLFALTLLATFGGGNSNNGYFGMGIVLGAVGFVTILYAYKGTKPRHCYPVKKQENFSLVKQLKYLKSGPWLIYLIVLTSLTIATGANQTAAMYYFTYVVQNQTLAGLALVIVFIFMIPGSIVAPSLSERFGRKTILISSFILNIAAILLMLTANVSMIFIGLSLTGFGLGAAVPLIGSLMPDIVDYGEWKHGQATPGILNSAASLGTKVGTGLGTSIVLWTLNMGGYVATASVQTAGAQGAITVSYIILPLIFNIICLTAILFYRIGNKREFILDELKKRHAILAENETEVVSQS